jgi:large-conductance mechanosensitive channel
LLTASINFLIVSLAMFFVIRLYNRFRSGGSTSKPAPTTNDLLTEIRDELRKHS